MRPHPLSMVYELRRFSWAFLLPTMRLFLSSAPFDQRIVQTARDWSLAAVLTVWAVTRWAFAEYRLQGVLRVKHGIWVRRHLTLSPDCTALISMEATPLMRLFRCRKIQISTANRRRKSDAILFLSKRQTDRFIQKNGGTQGYHAHLLPVVLMAVSGSNAAVGVLTLVPFVRQAATVLGDRLTAWYALSRSVAGLSSALEAVANLLLLGWIVAVAGTLLRTVGFRVYRQGERLDVASGSVTKRRVQMDARCISSLLLRQTLFTRLLGVFTVTIACAGYGRETGVRPVLIPAATKRELCRALDRLLPQFPLGRVTVRPNGKALWRYVTPPLCLIVAASGAYGWSDVITPLPTAILLVGGAWWLTVRIVGFFHAGIGLEDGAVVMRYPRGLAFYELHVPAASVDAVICKQGPWQRRRNTCHVALLCFGEKQRRHRVWGLDEKAVKQVFREI